MRYLKIRAKNYNEAMMKLKMDHGDDAIPISHKYVKEGGILNSKFFAREVVELTAAVQEKNYPSRKASAPKRSIDFTVDDRIIDKSAPSAPGAGNQRVTKDSSINNLAKTIDAVNDNLNTLKSDMHRERDRTADIAVAEAGQASAEQAGITKDASSINKFEKEFEEIKKVLNKLVNEGRTVPEKERSCSDESALLDGYMSILKNNEYDQEQRALIASEIKNSVSRDDLKDRYKIEKSLKDLLKSRIVTTGPLKIGNKKKIMMFIGPTGVGKTTTIAKLGAIHSLREGNRVAFVTIDNYRIAATEQLKKYAEIMRIPLHVVNNQKEFREVIASEKAEIIMVDTSGRSHRNEMKISEIKSFADLVEYDFEKILCVSANTKKMDLNEVFRAFNAMDFNSVVITKVDETSYIGNVVDIADKYNKPISYVTNGQEVPNDISVADPDKIVDLMIGTVNH
jgi:flagellar biosynthesis protein FlhF